MSQDFERIFLDFGEYSTLAQRFINEIEKGSPSLQSYLTKIQYMIANPSELIISKILAMRFARDIMVLGKPEVVNKLKRIVPHLVKICSHRLESDDPNRGQSFFLQHQEYITATSEARKKQIKLHGATFFVLCLESINKWAKWVPIDEQGNESEYSKGYNQLLQRGVKFQNVFHYYKNSDTDKFKNTYKVEFFTQSEYDNNSQQSSRALESVSSKFSTVSVHQIETTENLRKYLNSNEFSSKNPNKIDNLLKKVIGLYQQTKRAPKQAKNKKRDLEYLEKFIINYVLLQNKRISSKDFTREMTVQELELVENEQIEVAQQNFTKKMFLGNATSSYFKQKPTDKNQYEELLEKQEQSFTRKINFLKKQLQDRLTDLKTIKQKNQVEVQEIKAQYQSRIQLIKRGIIDNSGEKTRYLYQQNEALKEKLQAFGQREQEKYNITDEVENTSDRERELEIDNLRLGRQIQQLKIENEKLKNMRQPLSSPRQSVRESGINMQASNQIVELRNTIKKLTSELQNFKEKGGQADEEMNKKNKRITNLSEQLKLYKSELADERQKHRKQLERTSRVSKNIENELKVARERILHLQKKLDLKDIETAELIEQIKLCKLMDRQANIMLKNLNIEDRDRVSMKKNPSDFSNGSAFSKNNEMSSPPKMLGSPRNKNPTNFNFKFKKYETLRNKLWNKNKEEWYRLTRCALKKKDILFKENEFEIGIIFNEIGSDFMEAVLFFTNMSDCQMENFNLEGASQQSMYGKEGGEIKQESSTELILGTQFIFCLQPQEQEKIVLSIHRKQLVTQIYEPVYLLVQFKKKHKTFKNKIILPNFLFKSITYCPIKDHKFASFIGDTRHKFQNEQIMIDPSEEQYYTIKFVASTSIVPDSKSIPSYFPGLEKIVGDSESQKFWGVGSLDSLDKEGVCFVLKVELRKDNVMKIRLLPMRRRVSDKQQQTKISSVEEQIFRDYLSFIEFAFRR